MVRTSGPCASSGCADSSSTALPVVFFTLIFIVAHLFDLYAQVGRLKKENRNIRRELTDLRNLPLEEEEGQSGGFAASATRGGP